MASIPLGELLRRTSSDAAPPPARQAAGGGSRHKHRSSDSSASDALPLIAAGAAPGRSEESLDSLLPDTAAPVRPQPGSRQKTQKSGPRSIPLGGPPLSAFPANTICNQKYNIASFVPLVLYEQFKFFFNLYFLFVALSQFIPALQIGYIFTYFAPLCFVLFVTMGKEAYDDIQRYQRDKEANSQKFEIITRDGPELVASSAIKVGHMIRIHKNQRVPADCVLLRSSEPDGTCFIRTDQLDGETDWKLRLAIPSCQALNSDEALFHVLGTVDAEPPHKDIHSFIGNYTRIVDQDESLVEALDAENTLWANTVVASGTVIALVVYTGRESRAVLNTNQPSTKVGLLDLEINRLSKILFAVALATSFAMVALDGFRGLWYIYLVRFLILFSSIIPISLRVNLDLGKAIYSYQIMHDSDIPETIARTSDIPEELGRIEYLLSDKTGTLTQNEMVLKRLHMGTMAYGADTMDDVRNLLRESVSKDASAELVTYMRSKDIGSRIRDMTTALALCHNVTPVAERDGTFSYQASSPDEIAIVRWTESVGVALVARDIKAITLDVFGVRKAYDVLDVFPFTSERKRMGIVIRDAATDEITFYMKGADSVMAKIVMFNDWLDEETGNMAREGLRTLVVARKKIGPDAWTHFRRQYERAKASIDDRAGQTAAVIAKHLEIDMELLGLTGVEDKLQDDVKNTLEALRNAGLKIWMLTGDKVETATCISISSRLIARNQPVHTIAKLEDSFLARDELDKLSTKQDHALIIDGASLQTFLDHHRAAFVEIAVQLPVVVACRCSPTQKAEITLLIRQHTGRRVAAIGDGGNDVSMIQAAHVGVGIVGKEGRQASLAADYSVSQFRSVRKLLLWHGRNSYKRSAQLAQFVIHRGLIISVIQAVFSGIFYFAPIALYQGWLMVGYSTVYTSLPVLSLVLDQDVNEELAMMYPELYKELLKGRSLTFKTFFIWFLVSVYQGGAIMMLALWLFETEFLRVVSITFTALICNELLMVALKIHHWHRYMVYALVVSVATYFLSMLFLKNEFDLAFILTWAFLWKTAVITAVSSAPYYVVQAIRFRLNPPSYTKLGPV